MHNSQDNLDKKTYYTHAVCGKNIIKPFVRIVDE
jgi:hypothetical protein